MRVKKRGIILAIHVREKATMIQSNLFIWEKRWLWSNPIYPTWEIRRWWSNPIHLYERKGSGDPTLYIYVREKVATIQPYPSTWEKRQHDLTLTSFHDSMWKERQRWFKHIRPYKRKGTSNPTLFVCMGGKAVEIQPYTSMWKKRQWWSNPIHLYEKIGGGDPTLYIYMREKTVVIQS